jgi:hypothetical protein
MLWNGEFELFLDYAREAFAVKQKHTFEAVWASDRNEWSKAEIRSLVLKSNRSIFWHKRILR